MSKVFDGLGASEGIGAGRVHILTWGVPDVPHRSIEPEGVEAEVDHLREVVEWARVRLVDLEDSTEDRLGTVEARIFEPQLLMLEDHTLIEGAIRYVRENRLSAARALDWRMLELQAQWSRTAHPMVLDRINDLQDLQVRLLHQLLGLPDPTDVSALGEDVIVVARNLTPSLTVQLDPKLVLGIAADQGTRTAHWVMLARSLEIPTVCGLGVVSSQARAGQEAIVDGRIYTMGDKNGQSNLFCLKQQDGSILWSLKVGKSGGNYSGTRCTPTVDGSLVCARGQLGGLVCAG